MTDDLRKMLIALGLVSVGTLTFYLSVPMDSARNRDLRDAGLGDGQKVVITCDEALTKTTIRRINASQPGVLRPRQRYARVARVAVCFRGDGTTANCTKPDGGFPPADDGGTLIIPSLRKVANAALSDADAGEDQVDDALQFLLSGCQVDSCNVFEQTHPGFCSNGLNSMMVVTPPCVVPNCWQGDAGEWIDSAVVDCKRAHSGLDGQGPPRWAGCNVICPASEAVGADCLPSSGVVIAGDGADSL